MIFSPFPMATGKSTPLPRPAEFGDKGVTPITLFIRPAEYDLDWGVQREDYLASYKSPPVDLSLPPCYQSLLASSFQFPWRPPNKSLLYASEPELSSPCD